MRCHEARRLLDAYLDSELDAKTSCEIEDHLEACSGCATYFRSEEEMETRITGCLRAGEKSPGLWSEVEEKVSTSAAAVPAPVARPRRRVLWLGAVAAAATLLVALGLFWTARASTLELTPELVRRHQAFLDGIVEPSFVCPKEADFATCQGGLNAADFLLLPDAAGFHALGGRVCRIGSTPVAWTMAKMAGVPVSVISFRRDQLSHFPITQRRLADGSAVCCKSGRFCIAVRIVGDHVVCAVADAAQQVVEQVVGAAREQPTALAHNS